MKYSFSGINKQNKGESAASKVKGISGSRQDISAFTDNRQSAAREASLQLMIANSFRAGGQTANNAGPAGTIQLVLDDASHVVRGGLSAAGTLRTNQGNDPRGYISANSADGQTVATLATPPQPFPNGQITVTTVGAIRALQNDAGQAMDVLEDATLANQYHAAIDPAHNPMSVAESQSLSGAFTAQPNTWR